MTDYTELVKALRICSSELNCGDCPLLYRDSCSSDEMMRDAAAAIEELQAHLEESTKSADAYRTMCFTKHGDITIEKVRELDEKDCYFHSALIRLMYRRIKELEAQLPKRGEIVRCGECKWYGIYEAKKDGTPDKRYSPSVCLRGKYAKRRDPDWFCADGEREVQE